MTAIFPLEIVKQEMSPERYIDVPEEVQDILKSWRPSPLYRATQLEKALDTPAHIYYKYEGVSPSGSHKSNTAVAQAYYNKKEGTKYITTRDRCGPVGLRPLPGGQPLRHRHQGLHGEGELRPEALPPPDDGETWGAKVIPSPSMETAYGRSILAKDPDNQGSLGIAISEAVELALQRDDTKYALGSVSEPCGPAPDHHRPGNHQAAGSLRGPGRHRDRLPRRRLQFRGPLLPLRGARTSGASAARTRPAALPVEPYSCPHPHQGHLRIRLRRYRRDDAHHEDVHPGPRLHAPRSSTPAACATTALHPW